VKAREIYYGLRRNWARLVGAGTVSVALLCAVGPGGALAAETHAFDPVLSLTGDCSSSPSSDVDTVPDPGICPIPPGIVWPNPGAEHPSSAFSNPAGVATDSYGNIYVASAGPEAGLGKEGRIDVFDAKGNFITEIADAEGPSSLAIDSEGNLYVGNRFHEREVVRYEPTLPYEPEAGIIKYGSNPVTVIKESNVGVVAGLDIGRLSDPQVADHLFVNRGNFIEKYESAAEGNDFIESFSNSPNGGATGMAVDAAHGRIYASGEGAEGIEIRAYELAPPHEVLFTIKGTSVPSGKFVSGLLSLAVDEGSGHLFAYDGAILPPRVYEFETSDSGATYVKSIEHGFRQVFGAEIGVDNGEKSPNGALNPQERYLFVPSHPGGTGHSFAFGPSNAGPPAIESTSVANVGDEEAELEASIKPFGLETHYTFQYLTQQEYEENGETFSDVPIASAGDIPAGSLTVAVAAAIEGLEPETRYRFRVFAENTEGSDEAEDEFVTFPGPEPSPLCPNDALRSGFSALLPDCRAYELVTPPATNARAPRGVFHAEFATREASPSGGAVSFKIEGGLIPGNEGTGSLFGDPYLSTRGEGGWSTAIAGPNGAEVFQVVPGSISPDQGYSFWNTGGDGSAVIEGEQTFYVRYPDGHSALVGRGSLVDDPRGAGELISENGSHIIFVSGYNGPAIQLEPDAPPNGTITIYDRTADEVTHVVSLLPGDGTPAAGQNASYEGASLDGKGVAFKLGNTLYLRYNDEETYELGEGVTFAGIAVGGARAFYLKGGKLWRFEATSGKRVAFSVGAVTPVNISADGSTAYYVSQAVLTAEANPNGEVATLGEENLYRSQEGQVSFVGTVTERDVKGGSNGIEQVEGLGLWTTAVKEGRLLAIDPSRTTPDGDALLFESRAALDGYDPEGHAEVYRYDFSSEELDCLSCNPTLAPASSDASLQSISGDRGAPDPLGSSGYVTNLRLDGQRAFFQSDEALVPGDVDGLQDVYEWEAKGTGSCGREGGCVYLISSGHSLRADYLYAASDSGDDVFFRTSDILLPRDAEETPSIYDARVGGGFPEPSSPPCEGEACRPGVSLAPVSPNLASRASGPPGNVSTRCPKGKRKVKRHGKTVCVKKKKHHKKHHHKKHHQKKSGKSKGAGK
jgi:hypothetical protein